jgi:hypothetical protein
MAAYKNVAQVNEAIYTEFAQRLEGIPFLKVHREWVEEHRWAFGDRAFHYLWLLLFNFLFDIYAISPFSGNGSRSRILHQFRKIIQPRYRKFVALGNAYAQGDYLTACRIIFERFEQDFGKVHAIRGKSSDPNVYGQIQDVKFGLIYIDGDHSFEGVTSDIVHYCPLITTGGLLVMDDSSCELPEEGFFKGHPAVSKAARIIPSLGFKNVLNVGHNRVYLRIE